MAIYFLCPRLRKLTGGERLVLKLAEHLTLEGQPVKIVTHYLSETCRPVLADQVGLIETGHQLNVFHNHYLNAPLEYLMSPALLGEIGEDAEGICFFGPPSLPALWWAKIAKGVKVPCLYFCWEPPRFLYSDQKEVVSRMGMAGKLTHPLLPLYRRLDKRMTTQADAILTVSDFAAGQIEQAYGLTAYAITLGPSAIGPPDPRRVAELRERYGLANAQGTVLTVNHLHPRKRIDLFLHAMKHVVMNMPRAIALIVGTGPERRRLLNLRQELGLEKNVILCGFVPEKDLAAHYALSEIYVHTAKLESFGLSVIEAEANGLPVVSVDEGGPKETILSGQTGFLTKAEPASLANKILYLLQNRRQARQMGRAGQKYVTSKYRWEQGAREFLRIYRACQKR